MRTEEEQMRGDDTEPQKKSTLDVLLSHVLNPPYEVSPATKTREAAPAATRACFLFPLAEIVLRLCVDLPCRSDQN
jgi:hypothetical protein